MRSIDNSAAALRMIANFYLVEVGIPTTLAINARLAALETALKIAESKLQSHIRAVDVRGDRSNRHG